MVICLQAITQTIAAIRVHGIFISSQTAFNTASLFHFPIFSLSWLESFSSLFHHSIFPPFTSAPHDFHFTCPWVSISSKKKSPTIHFEEPSQTESDDPATWLASFIYVCLNLLPPHRFVLANHPIHTNISCIGRKKQKENENEFDGTNRNFYHLLFDRQQPQSQYPPRTSAGHGVRRSAATTGTARNSKEK